MKSKFRSYLLESVMLFVAVTASFFVENLREGFNEAKQEKKLVKIQLEDIILDTAQLKHIISERQKKLIILDSLSYLINSKNREGYLNRIYFFGRHITRVRDLYFSQNRRAFDQIRNSGGSSLISNSIVSESIDEYYAETDLLRDLESRERAYVDLYLPTSYKIFNGLEFDKMVTIQSKLIELTNNPQLLKSTNNYLPDFNAALHNVKSVNKAIMQDEKRLLKLAENVIGKINREYLELP